MYLYILLCEDNSLYTGIAKDVKKRIFAHYYKLKVAAKYTKSHGVIAVCAVWFCENSTDARKLEYAVKALNKEQKTVLIQNPNSIAKLFPEFNAKVYDLSLEDCI